MKPTLILKLLLLAALVTGMAAAVVSRPRGNQAARKPNVIIILGDDLGYCDTGLYGCQDIPTPNINSIANKGVLFTYGYVTAPVSAVKGYLQAAGIDPSRLKRGCWGATWVAWGGDVAELRGRLGGFLGSPLGPLNSSHSRPVV